MVVGHGEWGGDYGHYPIILNEACEISFLMLRTDRNGGMGEIMTVKERDQLASISKDLQEYHTDVKTHIVRCESYFGLMDRLNLDMYGNPEDRSGNPGVLASNQELRKSRKVMLRVATGAWTIATLLMGALASRWL